MVGFYIYLFITKGNKVVCFNYNVRFFTVTNLSLYLEPIDYRDTIQIPLTDNMRFEVIPYHYNKIS